MILLKNIRIDYHNVHIIIKIDSGFFDQKLFEVIERLYIGYVVSGKLYDNIKDYVAMVDGAGWKQYRNMELFKIL